MQREQWMRPHQDSAAREDQFLEIKAIDLNLLAEIDPEIDRGLNDLIQFNDCLVPRKHYAGIAPFRIDIEHRFDRIEKAKYRRGRRWSIGTGSSASSQPHRRIIDRGSGRGCRNEVS